MNEVLSNKERDSKEEDTTFDLDMCSQGQAHLHIHMYIAHTHTHTHNYACDSVQAL